MNSQLREQSPAAPQPSLRTRFPRLPVEVVHPALCARAGSLLSRASGSPLEALPQPSEGKGEGLRTAVPSPGRLLEKCHFSLTSSWKGNNPYCLWVQLAASAAAAFCFTAVWFGYVLEEGLTFSVRPRCDRDRGELSCHLVPRPAKPKVPLYCNPSVR